MTRQQECTFRKMIGAEKEKSVRQSEIIYESEFAKRVQLVKAVLVFTKRNESVICRQIYTLYDTAILSRKEFFKKLPTLIIVF